MTCYFRHLKEVFQKAGIELTPQNKAEIDKIIHKLVGVDYKNCPATWKHVKAHLAKDEASFILKLREEWQKSGH
ncbi:MAG: hypothetical protein NWF09_03140 [Candidatus Bathyarchaeota archaeon]|nr:hypothetical protein [Candidatus Bathyarchaeota archaeon]